MKCSYCGNNVNANDTLQEALEAKVDDGYEVLEIDEDDIEINYNF